MARILIIEHGEPGSASDIVRQIMGEYPGHCVEVTEPSNAPKLVEREPWDLVVVDVMGNREEAIEETMKIPGAMDDPMSDNAIPVAFITREPFFNCIDLGSPSCIECLGRPTNGTFDESLEKTSRIFYAPWQKETRDRVLRAVAIALRPCYRKKA